MTESTAFSFAGLSMEDAELPKVQRTTTVKDNPFIEPIKSRAGKAVTLPAAQVAQAVYLIRSAASGQGMGSRVVLLDSKGNKLDMGSKGGKSVVNPDTGKARTTGGKAIVVNQNGREFTGNVTVQFQGKDAKKTKKAEVASSTAPVSTPTAS